MIKDAEARTLTSSADDTAAAAMHNLGISSVPAAVYVLG